MTKIEEVARAIYNVQPLVDSQGPVPWDRFNAIPEPWATQARAAIEAMKTPTPEMRDAFLRNGETGATPSDEDSVEFTLNFNAAIEAALKATP